MHAFFELIFLCNRLGNAIGKTKAMKTQMAIAKEISKEGNLPRGIKQKHRDGKLVAVFCFEVEQRIMQAIPRAFLAELLRSVRPRLPVRAGWSAVPS